MKKVVYAVTRVGKYGNSKMTGFGFINETDLIALYKGADGKEVAKWHTSTSRKARKECCRLKFKPTAKTP